MESGLNIQTAAALSPALLIAACCSTSGGTINPLCERDLASGWLVHVQFRSVLK